MRLEELGFEYLEEVKRIEKRIKNTKEAIKTARGTRHIRLLRELEMLRQMHRECEDTAYHLIHYYKPCEKLKKIS